MKLKIPAMHHHKASGQGRVSYKGKTFYFGKWNEDATERKYRRWVAEFVANDGIDTGTANDMPVSMLVAHYLNHCSKYYPATSSMQDIVACALEPVVKIYGDVLVSEFGAKAVRTVRSTWLCPDKGEPKSRATVNKYTAVIRRMFAWAAEMEYCDADTKARVASVTALKRNRSEARETADIEPVDEKHLAAVLAIAPGVLRDMINIQLLSGARPGEVCALRRGDIDATGDVWLARIKAHKGAWREDAKPRVLAFGPKAQTVLKAYLLRPAGAFVFDPRETLAQIHGSAGSHRRPNQQRETPKTARKVTDHYTVNTYRKAITRLCMKADIPVWRPNQLRKLAATRARARYDSLDAAQILLGHASADITQVYAKLDEARLIEIAKDLG